MEREIKFRAWDKANKRFLEIDAIVIARNNMPMIESDGVFYQIQGCQQILLHQYTGIKDRTGNEIFEGDIVRRHWDSSKPEDKVVVFKEGRFMWGDDKHATGLCSTWAEVVGNVHKVDKLGPCF